MAIVQQLKRSLGLRYVIVVVIGNIIGSGVYKKVAPMAAELHSSGWILICWILGGIITLFGALSNAEIAGMLANTGGEYVYYKKIYNRFFAFLYGWSNFAAIKTAAISSIAYVFAQSFHSIVNLPPVLISFSDFNIGGIFYPFADFNVKLTAIVLIILLTLINGTGVKTGAGLSTALLLLVLSGIAIIVLFGLTSHAAHPDNVWQTRTTTGNAISASALFTALLSAFWAYEGWNSAGFLGGEMKNPNRNLPLGMTIGLFIVISVYL